MIPAPAEAEKSIKNAAGKSYDREEIVFYRLTGHGEC